MRRVSRALLVGTAALACTLLVACGGDDDTGVFTDARPVVDAAVLPDAEPVIVDAAAPIDGAIDPAGPTITITSPTAPTAGDFSSGAIVTNGRFTVRCEAKTNPTSGQPVDASSVVIEVFGASGETFAYTGQPSLVANEFTADVSVEDYVNGKLTVRCTAADTNPAGPVTNSGEIDTFLDLGPKVRFFSPMENSNIASQVTVLFQVTANPVAAADTTLATPDFANVSVAIGGVALTVGAVGTGANIEYDAATGFFSGSLNFEDSIFDPPLDGPVTIVVNAPNTRTTTATVRIQTLVFTADSAGPTIVVSSPSPGELVSGVVTVRAKVTDDAGVDSLSVVATIAGTQQFSLQPIGSDDYEGVFDTRDLGIGMVFPTVVVRAKDAVGNQSVYGFLVTLDNVAPIASLDPPNMRESAFSAIDGEIQCGELFNPLGGDEANDGQTVPQLMPIRVRVEDRGNGATQNPGTVIPIAGVNDSKTQLYVLDDHTQPLIVDTDGDGVCDSINPKLVPTSVPSGANEAAVIDMVALTKNGASIFRDPADPPSEEQPALLSSAPESTCFPVGLSADEPVIQPPVCDQSPGQRITEVEIGDDPVIYSIPPVTETQCWGNAFDAAATNISDGWACAAVAATDNLGNHAVSPPLRICFDRDGDGTTGTGGGGVSLISIGCGDGEITAASVGVTYVGRAPEEIHSSADHVCVRSESGAVRCWGRGTDGRLGYSSEANIGDNEDPAARGNVKLVGSQIAIAAGGEHTCAIRDAGEVICWGNNDWGQLGRGNTNDLGDNEHPESATFIQLGDDGGAPATPLPAKLIATGEHHTCAVMSDEKVYCFGRGDDGRLGYGDTITQGDDVGEEPVNVGAVATGFVTIDEIVAGQAHTCARSGDSIRCWGANGAGQLGQGNNIPIGDTELPATVGPINHGLSNIKMMVAGYNHTCILDDAGKVRCWGANDSGQLGYGDTNAVGDNESPASAGDVTLGFTAVHIAAGERHTCAVSDAGAVRCWGEGDNGRLGLDNTNDIGDDENATVDVTLPAGVKAKAVAAGRAHTCIVQESDQVRCWGASNYGQLGRRHKTDVGYGSDGRSDFGDIADVGDRPNCTGRYDPTTDQIVAGTCTPPSSFKDDPRWQLRRKDL